MIFPCSSVFEVNALRIGNHSNQSYQTQKKIALKSLSYVRFSTIKNNAREKWAFSIFIFILKLNPRKKKENVFWRNKWNNSYAALTFEIFQFWKYVFWIKWNMKCIFGYSISTSRILLYFKWMEKFHFVSEFNASDEYH